MQDNRKNNISGVASNGMWVKSIQISPNRDRSGSFFVRMDINDTIVKKVISPQHLTVVLEALFRGGNTIEQLRYW